jgi:hypothetical protein
MKKILIPAFTIIIIFSIGCNETAYLSPLNSISHTYHTIPLNSDKLKGATYVNANLTTGGANLDLNDDVFCFNTGIDRSFNFGKFQAYCSGNLSLGNYQMNEKNQNSYYYPEDTSTNKSFGAYGFNGAIDFVLPFDNGGEWRVLGLETSLQREFGNYLQFRKNFDDPNALIVQTSDWVNTLGIYTEFAWKAWDDGSFGFKIASGGTFVSSKNYVGLESYHTPGYFSITYRLTKDRTTGFLEMVTGTYAANLQLGVNYCLSHNKHNL